MGRPKFEKEMKQVAAYLDIELYDKWREEALRQYGDANFSSFVRRAIENFLKKEKINR